MLIDRYIARAQLNAFVIVFVSLAGLTFVVDAFTNMEEFLSHAAEAGGLWRVLSRYYGYRLVAFFDAASPVISLASSMFALSWLERHNEVTALLAAGVPRWRIARAAIVFAAAVAMVAAVSREVVLPRIREAISRNAQDLRGDKPQPFEARYDHATDILFRGKSVQAGLGRIESPSLRLPQVLGDFGQDIEAVEAHWLPADATHGAGYLLSGVRKPKGIDRIEPLESGGRVILQTPAGAAWLQPGQCFVASDVTFEQLIGSGNWVQYSSTPELVRAIANPSLGVGPEVPLRVHSRVLAPLLDMTLALLGLPLVLGPSRRGVFVAVGMCVGMTVLFFLVTLGCHAVAATGMISPSAGAFAPLVILATLAAWNAQPMWQ
ncbi:MAG: LptF/LptG family permease [Planctomycetaceae bacterium]